MMQGRQAIMSNTTDLDRYRANWQDEIDSAALYNALAQIEKQPQLAGVYSRLAATEQQHADFWAEQLRTAGQSVPAPKISGRTRTLIWLAKRFGPSFERQPRLPQAGRIEGDSLAG
jgi:hypothetical protein